MTSGRLLIAIVLALPGVGAAFSGVTVRVAPDAVVARDVVTVGDIATVEGDEPLASRIRQVRFSPAPPPGGRHRLDAAAIRARLRTATLDPARVRVDVPETLVITRAFQVIPGEALVEAVRREARTRLPGAGDDLALLPIGRADDRRAPTGDVALTARLHDAPVNAAFLAATVTITAAGRDYETVTLTFRVGRYQQVLVTTRALDLRVVPGLADVRADRRLSTEAPADALTELNDVGDVEIAQALRAGDVVTARSLRPRILVKRGELVTLLLDGRGFRITAQGEAGEDARRGDTVRVVNATSRREVLGKVEGAGLVRVPFADAGSTR